MPTELIEAAKVDGATDVQVFWRVTLPQIGTTIGVVITALFVTVMKVFDIVKAMTNGNFGTQVIANKMFARRSGSPTAASARRSPSCSSLVLPVMWINVRRMRRERLSHDV